MPARRFLLLVAAALFAASANSQSAPVVQYAALHAAPAPSLDRYAGTYATDGGAIEVRAEGDHLVLLVHGAPVAGRLATLAPRHPALAAHAAALLDAWVADDLAPLVATVAPDRQAHAAESFEEYRSALVRGHGPAVAASVTGTFHQLDGRLVTLAQLLFERGSEWAALVWNEDGTLATMTRGLGPVVVGTVRPSGPDTFEGAATTVSFHREADGRIAEITVEGQLTAMR